MERGWAHDSPASSAIGREHVNMSPASRSLHSVGSEVTSGTKDT